MEKWLDTGAALFAIAAAILWFTSREVFTGDEQVGSIPERAVGLMNGCEALPCVKLSPQRHPSGS
jgi:hypothetical protein